MSARPDADAERGLWSIEKLVPGGDGFARLADGRVAFVAGGLPGDVIRPLAVEARKGHVRATRFELVSPGEGRVKPACPVADACGGCDFMALSPKAQLVQKEELLRSALERTGKVSNLPERLPFTAAESDVGYRSRVRFQVDASGGIGFFARKSRTLVEIPGCLVCRPELGDALALLRRIPKHALVALSEIEVRCSDSAPRISVSFVPRVAGGAGPSLRAAKGALPAAWALSLRGEESPDDAQQRFPLPEGAHLFAFPGVFTQVNWPMNVALVRAVLDGARARGVRRFLDAYAGAGNFSLPLLASGMVGISVERDARAVDCARRAAAELGLPVDGFVVGDAADTARDLFRKGEEFDLVVLDPPRSGAKEALESVVRLAPRAILLCSCDPVTLGRDVATLSAQGFLFDEVRGFDMFPSTHHLEALVWLTRPS